MTMVCQRRSHQRTHSPLCQKGTHLPIFLIRWSYRYVRLAFLYMYIKKSFRAACFQTISFLHNCYYGIYRTFVMDDWKKCYSNSDTNSVAIPYFWDNFDKENFSIWFGEYKYPEELGQIFMSCNLVSGT